MLIDIDQRKTFLYTSNKKIDAQRPSILFIHGAANDHSVWNTHTRYFSSHGWNAIAVDLPGHNKTSGPVISNIRESAEWILKCLDQLDIANTILVGHSMGSLIALESASLQPHRITKLVLIGTCYPMPVSPQLLELAKSKPEQAYELINHYSFSDRAKLGTSQMPGLSMLGSSIQLMQRSAPGVLHADFTACNSYDNGVNAADQVSCPTLFLLGAEDKMTPVTGAENLIAHVKSNQVTVLPRTGHALMIEQPNVVLDCLVDFLPELN